MSVEEMYVTKRDGQREIVSFDKILQRIKKTGQEADIHINYTTLAMKVIDQLYDGITTTQIDELTADQCASLASTHPDYNTLAGRIVISNHQKNTLSSFSEVMKALYNYQDKHAKHSPLVSEELYQVVQDNGEALDQMIDYSRDYLIDFFGFKTLDRAYMMKLTRKTVERPQHMWMRVAIGIHTMKTNRANGYETNIARIKETYDAMSNKYFTHATPTLFNAGTPHPQLSSCFLLQLEHDSIDGIYNTLKDCAIISKWAGGIGLHIHNVRATGSHIRGTNGSSNGIVPMLRVFNNTAKYVDQCVLPETLIYTDQGPKQIASVVPGITRIFNVKGTLETVDRVLEHAYDGPMVEIGTHLPIDPLRITNQHPIFVLRRNETSKIHLDNELERRLIGFEWADAHTVEPGDWLVYPRPYHVVDFSVLTEHICYIYGLILMGIMPSTNPSPNLNKLCVAHTVDALREIQDFLRKWNVPFQYSDTEGFEFVEWSQTTVLPFCRNDFYDEQGNKSIGQRWRFLPIEKTKEILRGINLENSPNTSKRILTDALFLYLRAGTLHNLKMNGRSFEKHMHRYLLSDAHGEPTDYVLQEVEYVSAFSYKGTLYDLQMTEEHNYLLEQGLVHNGGGKRNGSFAIYLEPWHADIEAFLQMRKNHGDEELKARDLFYALWIPDLFMERVKADGEWTLMCPDECPGLADVYGQDFANLYEKYEKNGQGRKTMKARQLWFQVLDAQMETGTPYLLYKDAANKKSNQKNLGTIKSSNLCVAPETLILTDKGHVEIQTLAGQTVNVWNGEEFSEVEVFQTGQDQELVEVHTDDENVLTCTPYHKFFIKNQYHKNAVLVEAKDLSPGDKIQKCVFPVIDGQEPILYPYTHGFFCGDGTYSNNNHDHKQCKFKSLDGHFFCKRHIDFETEFSIEDIKNNPETNATECNAMSYVKKPMAYLYGEKKDLMDRMVYRSKTENGNRLILQLPLDIPEKFYVPMNASLADKMDWFAGYCDADGTIAINGDNRQLQISCINREFLLKVKLMLQTCGINPKIKHMRGAGQSYLPDGKGGHRYFDTQPVYRLLVTSCDLCALVANGFSPSRLKLDVNVPNRNAMQFVKISKVVLLERRDATYCFTEPLRHAGIFNGILTSQCSEIIQYSDDKESAVCNLASMALPAYLVKQTNQSDGISRTVFDYEKLHEMTKIVVYNLNKVIDVNYYPTEKTDRSNRRHRPIGLGVQGLADVFILLGLPFASDEAKTINRLIFETMYHAAVEQSCEMAQVDGPYETFQGSPASQGILQFDMWNVDPTSGRYDWSTLKQQVIEHGLRNSLLLAPMPTASTSQILGYNECIEPITSNIYSRRTLAGEFIMANRYLMKELIDLGLWNDTIKNNIIANHGSVQQLTVIPEDIREKYKTVWEIPMRALIDMAADRGAYVCQSQSLNLWLEDPTYSSLTSMHFYAWSKGLKTGIYYLRRRGRHQAQQFTIEPERKETEEKQNIMVEEEQEVCEMCSA